MSLSELCKSSWVDFCWKSYFSEQLSPTVLWLINCETSRRKVNNTRVQLTVNNVCLNWFHKITAVKIFVSEVMRRKDKLQKYIIYIYNPHLYAFLLLSTETPLI